MRALNHALKCLYMRCVLVCFAERFVLLCRFNKKAQATELCRTLNM